MNVSLTPHLDAFVSEKVAEGRYRSASEVVREGLRLLEAREAQLSDLRAALQEGRNSALSPGDEAMKRIRERLAKNHGV
jgi:antitoxin ParD1/3/4